MAGSLNHHFWGDFSHWFFRCITGVKINPNAEDYREIEISPHFISQLTHAEGYQNHPCGKIEARWQKEGNQYLLTLTLPEGFTFEGDTALQTGTHLYRITGDTR